MTLILYSLAKEPITTTIKGLFDIPIKQKEQNGIWAMYTDQFSEDLLASDVGVGKIDSHHAMVFYNLAGSIHALVPSLPVRFPTLLKDEQSLLKVIEKNRSGIYRNLNSLGNSIEHTFHITESHAVPQKERNKLNPKSGPGTKYLAEKLKEMEAPQFDQVLLKQVVLSFHDLFADEILDIETKSNASGLKIHMLTRKDWIPTKSAVSRLETLPKVQKVTYLGSSPPFQFSQLSLST